MPVSISRLFRIAVLSCNYLVYIPAALIGVRNFYNATFYPRIEILTGEPYVWPISYQIFFAVTNAVSATVLTFCILYVVVRQRSLLGVIALAISIHAFVSLFSYLELWRDGVTFDDSPIDFVGPLVFVALAAANWLVYKSMPLGRRA